MKQFMDIFSLPEMTLISCVTDFFITNGIDFDPVNLYKDTTVSLHIIALQSAYYKVY